MLLSSEILNEGLASPTLLRVLRRSVPRGGWTTDRRVASRRAEDPPTEERPQIKVGGYPINVPSPLFLLQLS